MIRHWDNSKKLTWIFYLLFPSAQVYAESNVADLKTCALLQDNVARLACYDSFVFKENLDRFGIIKKCSI